MKIYKAGEKSRGLCQSCKKLVSTTFKATTVPLSSGKGKVSDVLAAICNSCGVVVAIPQQSAPKIRESLHVKKRSIEARLPIHLLDILLYAGDSFAMGSPETLKDSLVRYYIGLATENKSMSKGFAKLLDSELATGKGDVRLSLKVNEAVYKKFDELQKKTKLSKTNLIKAIVLQINLDVLQKPSKKNLGEIERVMLASA